MKIMRNLTSLVPDTALNGESSKLLFGVSPEIGEKYSREHMHL